MTSGMPNKPMVRTAAALPSHGTCAKLEAAAHRPAVRSLRTSTSRFASRPPVAPRLSSSLDSRGVPEAS